MKDKFKKVIPLKRLQEKTKAMGSFRFSQRAIRFLTLYMTGYHTMETAAKEAGYNCTSKSAWSNTAHKILDKINKTPWGEIFFNEYQINRKEYCTIRDRQTDNDYYIANRERIAERNRVFYWANRDRILKRMRCQRNLRSPRKREHDNVKAFLLDDSYIKQIICKNSILEPSDVSGEMIELYRLKLRLKRLIHKTKLKGEQYVEHSRTTGSAVRPDCKVAE